MSSIRKLLNVIQENQQEVVSQQELMSLYSQNPVKPSAYYKVAIEAVIPRSSALAKELESSGLKGKVDSAKYNQEQPFMVIQGLKGGNSDIYTNTTDTLKQKLPNAKPDKLLIDALKNLGLTVEDIQQAEGGFYKKPALQVFMIPAKSLGVENKTIDAGWGTQMVNPGGFLVLEKYPNTTNIYCVNPDEDGLPIGYVPASGTNMTEDDAPSGPKITKLPYMGPKPTFYTIKLKDGSPLMDSGNQVKEFYSLEKAQRAVLDHPGSKVVPHHSERVPANLPDGRIEPNLFEVDVAENILRSQLSQNAAPTWKVGDVAMYRGKRVIVKDPNYDGRILVHEPWQSDNEGGGVYSPASPDQLQRVTERKKNNSQSTSDVTKINSDQESKNVQQPRNLKEWMNRVESISEAVVPPNAVEIPSATSGSNVAGTLITVQGNDPTLKGIIDSAVKNKKLVAVGSTAPQSTTSATKPVTTTSQSTTSATKPATTTPSSATTAQPVAEEEIDEVAAPGQEEWIKKNKARFVDQYGKKKGLSVLYATAWKRSKGKSESMNESKTTVMEGYTLEDILQRYPHEHKMCQEGWGLDEGLYEALADHYHKEGRIPYKVWHGPLEELRDHVTKCYAEDTGMLMDESVETANPGDAQFGPLEEVAPLAAVGAGLEAAAGEAGAEALGARRLGTAALSAAGRVGGALAGNEISDRLASESLYELDELDDVDMKNDDSDSGLEYEDDEFPFPDDMEDDEEDDDSMSVKQMNDMEQDDLLDEEDYIMEAKMKKHKRVSEETKETKTGRVHKAEPGGYGRRDDEDDDGKKVKKPADAPKRGRGRPKKDADSETGEVKKWDTETLARWIVGSKPDKLPGKASVKHKIKDESAKKSKKMDAQMEGWDRQLKALLNEGMTVTTSTGQPGGMDSVSVSATDSDAQTLMKLLQDAGIGLGGKFSGSAGSTDGQTISVEPVAHDEVMGQLQPEEDSGDDALGFLKRMLGARGGDTAMVDVDYEQEGDHDHEGHDEESCEECGHSPCDCDMRPVDEAEVEEGTAFTHALAKARADGVQKGEKMKVDGKEYPVKHGKKMDEEDEHDSDEEDSDEDNEEDDDEKDKEKVDEGQEAQSAASQFDPSMHERIKNATPQQLARMAQELAGPGSYGGYDSEYKLLQKAQTELRGGMTEGQQTCNECGGAMYEGHQCVTEDNNPQGPKITKLPYMGPKAAYYTIELADGSTLMYSDRSPEAFSSLEKAQARASKHRGAKVRAHHPERTPDDREGKIEPNLFEVDVAEELTEWANSPMGGSKDEDFKTELEYMTKLISGGLNGQKRDQTTLPHTKVKAEIIKEDISSTMKKLAGIK